MEALSFYHGFQQLSWGCQRSPTQPATSPLGCCFHACTLCTLLISMLPLLLSPVCPSPSCVFLSAASFTDWWSSYQATDDRMLYSLWLRFHCTHSHSFSLLTHGWLLTWLLWTVALWTAVWAGRPLYGDSSSSYGSGVVYIPLLWIKVVAEVFEEPPYCLPNQRN